MKKLDLQYPQCPIRNILSQFSDKWSLLVLSTLAHHEQLRYGEIKNEIPDISQKMLTLTLKKLVELKLIHREAFTEIPPRVEYSLTDSAKSFLPILEEMITWTFDHFSELKS